MGKNIKGKEYGKGIFQRKDGWYIARFVDKYGKRHEKYFRTSPEARNWQADSQYQDRHGSIAVPVNMTVDTWFDYWILQTVYENSKNQKRSETLSQELEYIDRHTGAKSKLVMNDSMLKAVSLFEESSPTAAV